MYLQALLSSLAMLSATCHLNAFPIVSEQSDEVQGTKGALSEDSSENLAEDVKAILWKLAATERLRSPAFIKVNQALQKTNKRACFWKYCVSK